MKNDVLKIFAQKAKRRLVGREATPSAKIKVISNEDENFKSKVESLLSRQDVVSNPVKYLMDDKVLSGLGDVQREKYLLDILDKYNEFKNKIETVPCDKYCM